MRDNGFLFGVQYYRAPTPEKQKWKDDLYNIKKNGFNSVKLWVQWRWTHRSENEFYFDDIDELMDIAAQNGLKVTLNVIFDVAPLWVTEKYKDSAIVLANGNEVLQRAVGHRQIGGFPGTCYSHKAAFRERMNFLSATVKRYKEHPALDMWDVWNEPEQCGPYRTPAAYELSCYCKNCERDFKVWLKEKYSTIEELNKVWGRCYNSFDEAELPRERFTFADFIDYREFNLDKMTKEANERIRLVKSIDKEHITYLHVVPNTSSVFNALTGVDDFELAKECDVFASTNFSKPIWSILTCSAASGKVCYNAECHIGNGSIKMHQKQIDLKDMTKDLLPQIGMGIKGFMFWQYRPEILGHEAPAWGTTDLNGSAGSVGTAARKFIKKLEPYTADIMTSPASEPEIAVWKGRKNELLSFCIDGELTGYAKSIEAYVNAIYYSNYNCRVVNDEIITGGLDGIKLLILPYCYGLDGKLAKAVDEFVLNGGTVLSEAHLGGYDADRGRHSCGMPGLGLDELWNIKEVYTTSSYYLKTLVDKNKPDTSGFEDDVKKALEVYGLNGGKNFKINTVWGIDLIGSERYACLNGDCDEIIGRFNGNPCIVKQKRGKGYIYYCGTNLGECAEINKESFAEFTERIIKSAGVKKNCPETGYGVHTDRISDNILIVNNSTGADAVIKLDGEYKMLFSNGSIKENECSVNAGCADMLVKNKNI